MLRLLLLASFLMGFTASAQNVLVGKVPVTAPSESNATGTTIRIYCGPVKLKSKPLYIIDGLAADSLRISQLNPDHIDSVRVMKGTAAIQQYGDLGKNGVVLITLKPGIKLK